jgi:hypothetical protein
MMNAAYTYEDNCNATTGYCASCSYFSKSWITFDVVIQVVGAADGSIQMLMTTCKSSTSETCGEGTTAPYERATLTQKTATHFNNTAVYINQIGAYPQAGGVQVDLMNSGATESIEFNGYGSVCVVRASGSGSVMSTSFSGPLTVQ